ncbi:CoA transferase [Alphaproteobacteria bacterium HT1-32]|nr:CoA transferase [Alphaproteobacteria bacterium HT1-32]
MKRADHIAPFRGLRVIDFTHVLAGPACAYYLGLMGADVIKVESVGRGDAMRHRGGTDRDAARAGMSTAYLTQGAGKKSLALDLGQPEGLEVMHRLLETADVLVENHRPCTLDELGLGQDLLAEKYPRLIHCAMTGYGRGGDRENAPAYDVNIQAISGIMTMTGPAGGGPVRTGAPIMDYSVALAAGFAISAALFQRQATGQGSFVDVSMLETAYTLMSSTITDYYATGHEPRQRGNAANSRSPSAGSFECREGVLSLGVNEEGQFANLARVLGCESWLSDPRYADPADRKDNADSLVEELSQRLKQRTATEWEDLMMANGVPAARLRTLPESLAMEQNAARHFIHTDPVTGVKNPTLPFRLNGAKAHNPSSPAPKLGEDSTDILSSLGYDAAEISGLLNNHIVGD